jgi:hypothetical protein
MWHMLEVATFDKRLRVNLQILHNVLCNVFCDPEGSTPAEAELSEHRSWQNAQATPSEQRGMCMPPGLQQQN